MKLPQDAERALLVLYLATEGWPAFAEKEQWLVFELLLGWDEAKFKNVMAILAEHDMAQKTKVTPE